MTQEERVVRETYAKLIFGTMIGSVHTVLEKNHNPALADLENQIADHKLSFELSNFVVGSVEEISKRPYSDLVTPPSGEDTLLVTQTTFNMAEDLSAAKQVRQTEEFGATASWSKGQVVSTEPWDIPFAEALPVIDSQNSSHYQRFASFSVTASFEGRSRSYKALFLFGNGETPILPLDNVTNNSALAIVVSHSVYPGILLDSALAQKAGVVDWLRLHQSNAVSCVSGKRTVCCDPVKLTCGVTSGDIHTSLQKVISESLQHAFPVPSMNRSSSGPSTHFMNVSARLVSQPLFPSIKRRTAARSTMSLPGNQSVLPPPSQPSRISYGQAANIDALNSYPNGFAIDLTTTMIGAFLATVPCVIRITPGSSTQAVWIKNTSGNQSLNSVVVCQGGTIDSNPFFVLKANAQFTIFTGDGAGNLTTS